MAFEKGNTLGANSKRVQRLLERIATQDDDKKLRQGLERVMDAFAEGERWAVEYVTDRLDGKAVQATTISNADGSNLFTSEVVELVRPK